MTRWLVDRVEERLWPLDLLRRETYRALAPWVGARLGDRGVRVAALSGLALATSFGSAVLFPALTLALGPLVFGVPHLVADVRYLVVRPGLHRRRGAVVVGLLVVTSAFVGLWPGFLAAALAAGAAAGPRWRRWVVASGWAGCAALAFVAAREVSVVVAQAHNLVAVLIWWALAASLHGGGPGPRQLWPALGAAVGVALIASGALDPVLAQQAGVRWPGTASLAAHARAVAPLADPVLARRGVVIFAFLQALHYGVWLRVVPEEARPRPASRSWLAGFRALRADLGDPALALALALALGLVAWGALDAGAARDAYVRLALFHGPLEFAALSVWLVEGRRGWAP